MKKIMKKIICGIKGHILEKESLTKTIGANNWCRKCTRCGRYILQCDIGSVVVSEAEAFEFAEDFKKEMERINRHISEV